MKKLILLGLILTLVVSCNQEPQRYFSESPEIESIKERIKAYEAQDWEAWKSHFADTAQVFHNKNTGIPYLESMKRHQDMISNFTSYGFSDDKTVLEMVIDKEGKKWVNYWSVWSGKLKANGKELVIPVHLTSQFADGKVVKEYGYYDTASITAAFIEIEAGEMESAEAVGEALN
ncbi:nuclear transport factor 2 family protein [Hwangdonia lutea]|uniref:Nuclear transport factor 2 family protein n=1 Tax=Hwangdonia lutea TaxID=3075823 RepID=A0AA97HR56_9FLAO|nr:nuclear transport factor 2 family protein [Hwangdonia sp. SCSIO 19198]WOD43068.1 nuclear transport factor 2 family protein [Hwangdonia sp. SCSIO 19198]